MKKTIFALAAMLLATFVSAEAKNVSRDEYCDELKKIIESLDRKDISYELSRSYGVFDALLEHCR